MDAYDEREEELGNELMRALERFMLLQIIDERWREHLHDMDYLREGIHLRSFAQIDPLVAYKNEGFEMFTGLMNAIWEEFARYVFNVEVQVEGQEEQRQSRVGDGRQHHVVHRQALVRRRPRRGRQRGDRRGGRPGVRRGRGARRRRCCFPSRSRPAGSTSTSGSAATIPAGAAAARSSRSAMGLGSNGALRDQLKLLSDYL